MMGKLIVPLNEKQFVWRRGEVAGWRHELALRGTFWHYCNRRLGEAPPSDSIRS